MQSPRSLHRITGKRQPISGGNDSSRTGPYGGSEPLDMSGSRSSHARRASASQRDNGVDSPDQAGRSESFLALLVRRMNEELRNEMDNLRQDFERMRQQILVEAASEAPPSYRD